MCLWAMVFVCEGLTALVEMLMIFPILVLGIRYAWSDRTLEWARYRRRRHLPDTALAKRTRRLLTRDEHLDGSPRRCSRR